MEDIKLTLSDCIDILRDSGNMEDAEKLLSISENMEDAKNRMSVFTGISDIMNHCDSLEMFAVSDMLFETIVSLRELWTMLE